MKQRVGLLCGWSHGGMVAIMEASLIYLYKGKVPEPGGREAGLPGVPGYAGTTWQKEWARVTGNWELGSTLRVLQGGEGWMPCQPWHPGTLVPTKPNNVRGNRQSVHDSESQPASKIRRYRIVVPLLVPPLVPSLARVVQTDGEDQFHQDTMIQDTDDAAL